MRPRVRWWVLALGIVLAWALTCFGPTAVQAQQVASDSATLRKLAEFHATGSLDLFACLAVSREDGGVIVIDSILGYREGPPCPEGTGGIAANAVPEGVALSIGQALLEQYPEFVIACALHGTRFVDIPSRPGVGSAPGAGVTRLFVPLVWCAYKSRP